MRLNLIITTNQYKSNCNGILTNSVLLTGNERSCVITLDDVSNGTCRALKDAGYKGSLRAVQRNVDILADQLISGSALFGDDFIVHRGDICKDFVKLAQVWAHPCQNVDLYNFDLMGTFWGEPALLVESIFKAPVGIGKGTKVAITCQAIGNGVLMTKLKNVEGWGDRIRQYEAMKGWKKKEIAKFYIEQMSELLSRNKPDCITVEPVPLESDWAGVYENCLVYGHSQKKHASTMIFMLYEFKHQTDCQHILVEEPIFTGEKRKRVVGGDARAIIEAEQTLIENLESDEELDDSENYPSSPKSPRLDDVSEEVEEFEEVGMDVDGEEGEIGTTPCPICLTVHFKHQTEAIEAINQNNRGIVHIPCGCGKSLIMKHVAGQHKISAIYAPTKNLVQQIAKDYFEADASFCCIKINSDNKYNWKDILAAINACPDWKPVVFVVNYQSVLQFQKLLGKLKVTLDVGLYDEAHHTSSKKKRELLRDRAQTEQGESDDEESDEESDASDDDDYDDECEDDVLGEDKLATEENEDAMSADDKYVRLDLEPSTEKRFFFSATPSKTMKSTPDIYGETIYRYSSKQAVLDGVVKNFDTVIDLYRDHGAAITDNTVDYERLVGNIKEVITERECKRVLVYTRTVVENELEPSVNILKKKALFSPHLVSFITASTKKKDREKILDDFSKDSSNVHILVSCKTISEGIDIANCDMVVMLDLTKSEILIIQRGLRASRLMPEGRKAGTWKNAVVYFPLNLSHTEFYAFTEAEDKKKYLNENVRRSQYEQPMLVLNSLKNDFDMEITWSVKKKDSRSDRRSRMTENTGGDTKRSPKANIQFRIDAGYEWMYENGERQFEGRMHSLLVSLKSQDLDEVWWKNARKLDGEVRTNGYPKKDTPLNTWMQRQKANKRGKGGLRLLTDDKISFLEQIPDWKWDFELEGEWWAKARELDEKVRTNGYPKKRTRLYNWLDNQKKGKRGTGNGNRPLTENQIRFLEQIPSWRWDFDLEGIWWKNARELDRQVRTSKYPKSETQLHKWMIRQKSIRRGKGGNARPFTEDMIHFLEQIPNWRWDFDVEQNWWAKARELDMEVRTNGFPKTQTRLNGWMAIQKAIKRGTYRETRALTKDKVTFLEQIPGWVWETYKK